MINEQALYYFGKIKLPRWLAHDMRQLFSETMLLLVLLLVCMFLGAAAADPAIVFPNSAVSTMVMGDLANVDLRPVGEQSQQQVRACVICFYVRAPLPTSCLPVQDPASLGHLHLWRRR